MPGISSLAPARIGLVVAVILLSLSACEDTIPDQPVKVEIAKTESGYTLLRDGKPYVIRGAGMGINDLERFARRGGNSIRTWSTNSGDQDTTALLDAAYRNGVTVALGLEMTPERRGFDYNDENAVREQFEAIREEVLKYKDHPALLVWIIGNELDMHAENPAVYDAVNEISRMIHELDPNHPTTSTQAEFDVPDVETIKQRAPDLDFHSFQVYGGLFSLPERIAATGYDAPIMVTEWGAIGYWETETTSWGAPLEMDSSEKAEVFSRGFHEQLAAIDDLLIGSYAFLWGQKQERTHTWFGLMTEDGRLTEAVDVLQHAWTGEWPANRAPRVLDMRLDGRIAKDSILLRAGEQYPVSFDVEDIGDDPLNYAWELKSESNANSVGGDFEDSLPNLPDAFADASAAQTLLTAPPPGNYRLFANVYDGNGNAAHANIPFRVGRTLQQSAAHLLAGESMAISYSGYRSGQHPDRGEGAANPSDDEVLEDLQILLDNDFKLIRLYDADTKSQQVLRLIREHDMPIKVLLGMWLRAEVSNHEGCPWLDEPIPGSELASNTRRNKQEIETGIRLARTYDDIIIAVNVGNEALVDWNDHMVPVESVIAYVEQVQSAIVQPVTVADNFLWWADDGDELAAVVDFIGIHTYAIWEDKIIDEAMSFTLDNLQAVRDRFPDKPYAILEAGWPTTASEFGDIASVSSQLRYFDELKDWASKNNVTVFWFAAFDEPWKGDPDNPLGAEKHWGLYYEDRTPKHRE